MCMWMCLCRVVVECKRDRRCVSTRLFFSSSCLCDDVTESKTFGRWRALSFSFLPSLDLFTQELSSHVSFPSRFSSRCGFSGVRAPRILNQDVPSWAHSSSALSLEFFLSSVASRGRYLSLVCIQTRMCTYRAHTRVYLGVDLAGVLRGTSLFCVWGIGISG